VKALLDIAIKKPKLRNEIFCQLIKQTTQNPHADNLIRAWQLMAVCCGTFIPAKDLLPYLRAHLQRTHAQGGEKALTMYASFSNIRLQRAIVFGGRKEVPSGAEITSVLARRPYGLRVKTLDGKLKAVGIDPTTLSKDIVSKVARKLNLRSDFKGFALFEVLDDNQDEERCVPDSELIGESMRKIEETEKAGKSSQLVFKRRIFLNPSPMEGELIQDPVLRDLLFHQALNDIVHDKFPLISERDAVKQAAFQLQILWGDHDPNRDVVKQQIANEAGLAKHVPRRLIPKMKLEQWQMEISTFYAALVGRSKEECKELYMKYIRKWPMYGDSIFNVKQSARATMPKDLWLAVGRDSVKILGVAEEIPLLTFPFESIAHYGPSSATFFMVAGNLMNSQKYVFNTKQAQDIAAVLAVYMAEVKEKQKATKKIN
jgi:myosin-7